jgi:DNA polymerase III epsilon subunit-like protein
MIAVIDIETNGYYNDEGSILEIAIIKLNKDLIEVERYHRYYLAHNKKYNYLATKVHGLKSSFLIKEIKNDKKKKNLNFYPYFFKDDKTYENFMKNVTSVVAHNVSFENKFLNLEKKYKLFCTMKSNKDFVFVKNKNGNLKLPNLKETAEKYNIVFDENKYHSALYDTEIAVKIIQEMQLKNINLLDSLNINKILKKSNKNQIEFKF